MAQTLARIQSDLYVATRQGIVAISSEGAEPEAFPFALYGFFTRTLLADGKGVLLAAGTGDRGVRVSRDGGREWAEARDLAAGDVRALAADGASVWAGLAPAALARSQDGGASFTSLPLAPALSAAWGPPPGEDGPRVTSLLARPGRLYVAVHTGGVLCSTDGGRSFQDVSGALPASVLGLAAGGAGHEVLALTAAGLYRSDDPASGAWSALWRDRRRAAVTALGAHPREPRLLVCGAASALGLAKPAVPQGADAWIYRSADGGATWTEAGSGLLPVLRGIATSVVFAPADPAHVFVGTSSGEIFESRDAGASFRMTVATLPGVLAMVAGPALF